MMLWCELHNTSGVKGGITNFDPTEYEKDLHQLSAVTQARARLQAWFSATEAHKSSECVGCVLWCTYLDLGFHVAVDPGAHHSRWQMYNAAQSQIGKHETQFASLL